MMLHQFLSLVRLTLVKEELNTNDISEYRFTRTCTG